MGGIACGRTNRRARRRRDVVVDGLALGKTEGRRGNGSGRRKDDVHGRSLFGMATYCVDDFYRRLIRIAGGDCGNAATARTKHADASALWRLLRERCGR